MGRQLLPFQAGLSFRAVSDLPPAASREPWAPRIAIGSPAGRRPQRRATQERNAAPPPFSVKLSLLSMLAGVAILAAVARLELILRIKPVWAAALLPLVGTMLAALGLGWTVFRSLPLRFQTGMRGNLAGFFLGVGCALAAVQTLFALAELLVP